MASVTEELKKVVKKGAKKHHVPGVAVAVYSKGKEDYVYHGVTSVENPLPVDRNTLFQIGSTGKTYTATAMMRLVEQGRVSLDDPVRKHVPELRLRDPEVAEKVTVLQILNHTAGWNGDFFEDTGWGEDALKAYVRKMRGLKQLFPPGSPRGSYNNASLALAGRLIEKVTGKSFEKAVKELVLDPIGLEHSFYDTAEIMTHRFAVGHYNEKGKDPEVVRPWRMSWNVNPMGGLSSTAEDQLRWARFHLGDGTGKDGKRVLKKRSLDLMKKPTAKLPVALGDNVGISWLMKNVGGVQLVGHGGTTIGQLSAFQMVPERDFAVTVLTNSMNGGYLHRDIVKWTLEHYLGVTEPEAEGLDLPAEELAAYAGTYETDGGWIDITVVKDHLEVRSRPNERTLKQMEAMGRPYKDDQPPTEIKLMPDDMWVVISGAAKGSKGEFVMRNGSVEAINLGGRLAKKLS